MKKFNNKKFVEEFGKLIFRDRSELVGHVYKI